MLFYLNISQVTWYHIYIRVIHVEKYSLSKTNSAQMRSNNQYLLKTPQQKWKK